MAKIIEYKVDEYAEAGPIVIFLAVIIGVAPVFVIIKDKVFLAG